jgi:hypothetical protein
MSPIAKCTYLFSPKGCRKSLLLTFGLVLWVCAYVLQTNATDSGDIEFFESRIRPVLVERCYKCHSAGAEKLKGGLMLDSREGLLKGGDSGPAIELGHLEKSRLITAIEYQDVDLQMPPKGKLSEGQIADFREWMKRGAPWGEAKLAAASKKEKKFDLEQRKREHWAWRELQVSEPSKDYGSNPIDGFVFAKLKSAGLKHALQADKRTLIRRVTFDLTGLPPTAEEASAFVNDDSADAFTRVVDRLLDSPRFGERWARHWLDLVRYAETYGHEFDYPILGAWHYRDYVIRAFNSNLPYDRFVKEQMAGDLLENPRWINGTNESLLGTMFWSLGQQVHSPVDVRVHTNDRIDNEIDVATKTFLGLTVACARCHDHKFDAIATKDYYSMFSVLASSRYAQRSIRADDDAKIAELARLKDQLRPLLSKDWIDQIEKIPEAEFQGTDIPSGSVATEELPRFITFAQASNQPNTNDFSSWLSDGTAFKSPIVNPGEILIRGENKIDVSEGVAIDSGGISRRLQGCFRSPDFTIKNRYLYLHWAGHSARANIVVDGFTLIRDPIYGGLRKVIESDGFKWDRVDLSMWQGHSAYVEFADITAGDRSDDGRNYGKDAWLAIERVVFSDSTEPPQIGAPGKMLLGERETMKRTLEAWGAGKASPWESHMVGILVKARKLQVTSEPALAVLKRFHQIEETLPEPVYIGSITDGPGFDESIFIRGNYKTPGPPAPRGFLTALKCANEKITRGSGRLEIAREMLTTPLAARARVNWIWHHLFGRGLVASVDNFGVLGERPSHPELLDWLANNFRTNGWNMKQTIRLIASSATYQMSSAPEDQESERKDANNLLLHRANIRRLEGETIRDSILAVAGTLKTNMYGISVPIHLTPFMDGRGRPGQSGPLDGDGRRTIYIEVRRNFLSPMMLAFDAPTPLSTVGRRTVSNVPAQALIMLNDPFVVEEAQQWAGRMMSCASVDDRIKTMYEMAFARPPASEELEDAKAFLSDESASYGLKSEQILGSREVWNDLCHVLFNVKEFIYVN